MVRLSTDYDWYNAQVNKLKQIAGGLANLSVTHQKIIAEVIILRLFDLLVGLIIVVAAKIAQGSVYLDGSHPNILVPAVRSKQNAIKLFSNYGRLKPKNNMRWSTSYEIQKNVGKIIDPNDNFTQVITRYSIAINEIRKVRNRIAHNNQKARNDYQTVISHYYGANLNHIIPGTLLLTDRWNPSPPLLSQYISWAAICAKELVKK